AGTVQKTAGTGTTTFEIPFNNAGTVTAQTGTIAFSSGGIIESNFSAASGAAIHFSNGAFSYSTVPVMTGPGNIQFTGGTLTLLDDVIPGLQLASGTISLSPSFQGGSITNLTIGGGLSGDYAVSGTLTLGNGDSGTLTVLNGAALNWTGGNVSGLVLNDGATVNWSGGTLAGELDITNGATVNWSGGTAANIMNVESNGLLNLTGGTMYLENVLTNAGTVEWLGGNFVVYNNGGSYSGAVENLAGALWDIQCNQQLYNGYSNPTYFHNAGTVQKTAGTGTTTISIAFNNDVGTLDVETGVVSFNENNSYGQTDGTLQFGLDGPSHSGKVQIAGNINFDGTLAADLTGGYVPQAGDTISLVTYGSQAGVFNNLNLPPLSSVLGWRISYNATALQIGVVSNANSTAQITGSVKDNSARAVTNVTVFAYTTNSSGGLFLSTVTDAGGNYSLSVSNGTWFVGLQGLPARGYNPVANQVVTVADANQTANFVLQPYSQQFYTITTAVNPPGAGTATGGGVFAESSPVTVNATAIADTLPYYFANWTENGVFESASANYTFIASRNRTLTANFTLPTYQISATNNPSAGGTVSGQGTYFYGTTNVLTANANYGYSFSNWTENGSILATTVSFTNIVTSNRVVSANYSEANTFHIVTTATSPANVATVTGAGTYNNGDTATISAPASVTLSPYIYTFHEFQLNGTLAGNNASISKTFSTLDPTQMDYVAVYDTKSILPTVIGVTAGFTNAVQGGFTVVTNPVPVATNYQITLQFERSMDASVTPLVVITNSSASVQPFVPGNGAWFKTTVSNDTYRTPFITFSNGMDGPALVQVSGASDPQGRQMAATNVAALVIDVTPPLNPTISLVGSNSSSAEVSWSSYTPPADLGSFRVYLSANNFSSVAGLTPVSALGAGARSYLFTGLSLDRPYYAVAVAVDVAGNSSPLVTPLSFTLASAVPPPVPVQVTAVGDSSALVSWNSYDTSRLLGFAGFQLYYETSAFTSVSSLTPKQTLAVGANSVQIDNLDRTKTYYFAVVGYNVNNGFNPNVTTASWSDPYAGNISVNTTLGGSGQSVVDILHSITVVNNAILTITAGTTLRFAPGTSLTVQQGALFANGTPLDPVIFTSTNDQSGETPAAGDWNGITLDSGASPSVLMNVFVKYGEGLTLDNCAPTVGAFSGMNNAPAGLTLQNGATLNTAGALLAFNGIGAQQLGASRLEITNSVIQNNDTNALAAGGLNLYANADWWGSATQVDIDATLRGAVDSSDFLTSEPLLTPAIGTSNNVTQVGSPSVNLRLACRTADSMRLSEDSTFSGTFFTPFTNAAPFPLSNGGGEKTIFAQFRSVTGETSAPVSITLNYVTAGPAITAFNLSEGEVLTRPLTVTGSATAPLGVADMEFYVDDVAQGTNTGGAFSQWFDARNFSVGTHRVELLARDESGNVATLEHNVVISPTPPPAPTITTPATDIVIDTNTVNVSGAAEPFIQVRLFDSGALMGTTNAAADGTFSFSNVPLVEGENQITATAMDALGSANSGVRTVNVDTTPPSQLIMNPPVYTPGSGLSLTWLYLASGKRASSFEVFWSTSPITDPAQAIGHTIPLSSMNTTVQGLATGDYYFYVVGYDALNNASPLSAPVTFHYDAVPPAFSVAFDKVSPVGVGMVHVILT
ncbi:MAG: beta strand repeat-containing protein, partial [Limisphaerales bacterium]